MFKTKNNFEEAVKKVERNPVWKSCNDVDFVGKVNIKSNIKLTALQECRLLGFFAAHIYNMSEDINNVEIEMSEEIFEYERIVRINKSSDSYTILII